MDKKRNRAKKTFFYFYSLKLVLMDSELNSQEKKLVFTNQKIESGTGKRSHTWKSSLKLRKNELWHRKAQYQEMVEPNSLYPPDPRILGSKNQPKIQLSAPTKIRQGL